MKLVYRLQALRRMKIQYYKFQVSDIFGSVELYMFVSSFNIFDPLRWSRIVSI